MTSYEIAPATKLVATHCAACNRPLVDSVSVEFGMGPDCREKYMGDVAVSPEDQAAANRHVHYIATFRDDARVVANSLKELRALGFHRLFDKLAPKVAAINVTLEGGRLWVSAPYDHAAVARFRGVLGRRFDGRTKRWHFPESSRIALWTALQVSFRGEIVTGPKGATVLY